MKYQPSKTAKLLGGKNVNELIHCFVEFRVFLRNYLVKWAHIFTDNCNFDTILIFREFILIA